MVLITGGAYSGLEEFAKKQGYLNRKQYYVSEIVSSYEEKKETLDVFLQNWLLEETKIQEQVLIFHEEVGCGLIPDTKEKRESRELQGRAACFFATASSKVYRVCCGLGLKIK